ncbi:MAG TPA: tetratricopeptide repeat protein, partial [Syntrophales bacterium]|nr:tetratricopeptide repeat protein [Syntrophales bacterium]HOH46140.1 tetratricopeptide repeat protein [Syntrophales bacterium]HPX02790.1 tetratricopeptide repeat protein [Syntrophales bacterium]
MDEAIVRERASEISRTLGSCRKFIHQGKVYACLSGFKDVLEKMLVTRMLPQDEKDLQEGINEFQRQLMSSAAFRNAFGPVTFQDNDNETSLAFIRQLVNVSEEEIAANLAGGNESPENRALMIMRIIDKGEHEKARALIGNNEDLLCFILQTYNARGIQARREGSYGKAVEELKKALSVAPDDEGILYNLARAYAAKKEKKPAVEFIRKALQINPAFA